MKLEPFEQLLGRAWPPAAWQDVTILAAVSGGADSVAMLRGLARLKSGGAGRIEVGHFNHGLRGAEAQADEQFVVELCRQLGLASHVGRVLPGRLQSDGDGVEAAARAARYRFLRETAEQLGARYVVTAHTADDQAETILGRIVRGTGLAGLAGMHRARPLGPAVTLLRPLLEMSRRNLRSYLQELGQLWCEDTTNAATNATRNWIRLELMPLLESQMNPAAAEAIVRLGDLAHQAQGLLQELASRLAERAIASDGNGGIICAVEPLIGQSRYLVREMFLMAWRERGWPEQAMGFAAWDELAEAALGGGLAHPDWQRDLPGGIRAQKKGVQLILARRAW